MDPKAVTEVEKDATEYKKPFGEHLDELFVRARRSFIWLILGCGVGYLCAEVFVKVIEAPIHDLVAVDGLKAPKLISTMPFEKFWVFIRVAVTSGLFFVVPLIGREIAAFVSPGLKANERRRIWWLTISIYVVFMLGIVIGYQFVLPMVLKAIMRFGSGGNEDPMWTISAYFNSAMGILVVSALLLELPVVMTHLSAWGWVEPETWAKGRRISIVINAIVSGVLSPPDVASMLAMMIPVQILYESGILFSRVAKWASHDKKKD